MDGDGVLLQVVETNRKYKRTPIVSSEGSEYEYGLAGKKNKLVISLHFSPGLYRSVGYIGLIRRMEEKNFKANIISGLGFGAVLAAMYSFGKTPDNMEWFFYSLHQKTKGLSEFSKEWKIELRKLLEKSFGDAKIQNAKKVLLLPLWNQKKMSPKMMTIGKVVEVLMTNFEFEGTLKIISAINKYKVSKKMFSRYGADISYIITSINRKSVGKNLSGFYSGIYSQAFNIQEQVADEMVKYRVEMSDMKLDEGNYFQKRILDSYRGAISIVNKMKEEAGRK